MECRQASRAVPAEVAAMPCGLLRWQIQDQVTRSSTALDQLLAGRPSGSLAQIIDVPNVRQTWDSPATLPLTCLTGWMGMYRRGRQRRWPQGDRLTASGDRQPVSGGRQTALRDVPT
jgi:hypothetical protein